MRYEDISFGIFIKRPNRFIAVVSIGGREQTVHVKNTGRCRELLVPGARVILEHHADYQKAGRKTEYSLIAVYKGDMLINMDSQAPNQAAAEWLRWCAANRKIHGIHDIRREVTYGNSRFDLAFSTPGRRAFMEVKGVTLEKDGVAMFPDAPTDRGLKHLLELADAARQGYLAFIFFVIQMKGVKYFAPNWETHEEFARTLYEVHRMGVHVIAYDCQVREDSLEIDEPVEVRWRFSKMY